MAHLLRNSLPAATMKMLATAALAAALSLASAHAAAAEPAAEAERPLIQAAQAMFDAQKNFDLAALDAILAPDYVEISPIGDVDERAEVLSFYTPQAKAQMQAGGMELVSTAMAEPRVRIYGDQAIVVSKNTATLKVQGAEQQRQARVLFHFRKLGGKWLLQSSQFTWIRPGG